MDERERVRIRDEVRPALQEERDRRDVTEIAKEIGISRQTFYKLVDDDSPPGPKTLRKVQRWVDRGRTRAGDARGEMKVAEPTAAPYGAAGRLTELLDQRAGLRRLAREIPTADLIKAAYAIAIADGWPRDEIRKLDQWREQLLDQEGEA